jgi:hypothetical protein
MAIEGTQLEYVAAHSPAAPSLLCRPENFGKMHVPGYMWLKCILGEGELFYMSQQAHLWLMAILGEGELSYITKQGYIFRRSADDCMLWKSRHVVWSVFSVGNKVGR